MNPPTSLSDRQDTSREVPVQDVLADTGVFPNASQPAPDDSDAPISLETVLRQQMEEFRTRSLAVNTIRGYECDWRDFEAWCERQNRSALPADAETLCLYLVDCAQRLTKPTLDRRIAAIGRRHKVAGYPNPTAEAKFREFMAGVRRTKKKPQAAKRPLLSQDLIEILEQLDPGTAQSARVRALLLVGFTGALRRSELVNLDVEDVRWTQQGMIITIRSSKMEQEGRGTEVGIPFGRKAETCPVGLLKAWLKFAGIKSGPIFRPIAESGATRHRRLGDRAVALIIKRTVGHAGFSPEDSAVIPCARVLPPRREDAQALYPQGLPLSRKCRLGF